MTRQRRSPRGLLRPRPSAGGLLVLLVCGLVAPLPAAATRATSAAVGWRGDGSGLYPEARPPLHWSTTENLRWSTVLPSDGKASPIRVGRCVFVTAEPLSLLCLDVHTGEILWQRDHPYIATLEGAELQRAQAIMREYDGWEARLEAAQQECYRLRRLMRKVDGTPEQLRREAELEREVSELRERMAGVGRLGPLPPLDFVGYASSSPASDGERVFALFGNGVVAAYDLEGVRLWIRWLGDPASMASREPGHAASPVVVGDVLVVGMGRLTGLDVRTGETRWQATPYDRFGTPAVARVDGADLVVTPSGDAVRASDGRILARGLSTLFWLGPLAVDQRVYFLGGADLLSSMRSSGRSTGTGFQLTMDGPQALSAAPLWTVPLSKGRSYSGPVHHAGLLYSLSSAGTIVVLDALTGEVRGGKDVGEAHSSAPFCSSLALAGGHLFATDARANTIVLEVGPDLREVAYNVLDETAHSNLCFDGEDVYIRTATRLYAIRAQAR